MSTDVTQERIRSALSGVLQPLARTLLRCGVSYTEFAELAKRAFVDAASRDYGVRNRPTNIARVAVMTGLSRKEVSRIRGDAKKGKNRPAPYRNLPAEILHCWHTSPAFLDVAGHPRALAVSGGKRSFTDLVKNISSDIPARAMLRELQRAGALRYTTGRKLVPTRREFVPDSVDEKLIEGLQYGLRRLAETVSYNAQPENRKTSRFQRIVHTDRIPMSEANVVRDSLEAILASFATKIDDYLTSFHAKHSARKIDKDFTMHVGVGLYYFDNSN